MKLARHGLGAVLALALAGCAQVVEAPSDPGVCWHMVQQKTGKPRFFKLSQNQPDLEHCAANLEAMRSKFLRMGGGLDEVDGAYQGEFIFIDKRGVFTAQSLDAIPFPTLVRTGDGRLAPAGSGPQDSGP